MLCAELTNDFLFSGTAKDIHWFDEQSRKRFNGARIEQDQNGNITVSMEAYMERVVHIPIHQNRRIEQDCVLNEEETTQYRGLAGQLNWASRAAVQVACFPASDMVHRLGKVRVKDVCTSNEMLSELCKHVPRILYKSPKKPTVESFVGSFANAPFKIYAARSYGRNQFNAGIYMESKEATLSRSLLATGVQASKGAYATRLLAQKSGRQQMVTIARSICVNR